MHICLPVREDKQLLEPILHENDCVMYQLKESFFFKIVTFFSLHARTNRWMETLFIYIWVRLFVCAYLTVRKREERGVNVPSATEASMEMYFKILAKPPLTEQVKDFIISDHNEAKYESPFVPKK